MTQPDIQFSSATLHEDHQPGKKAPVFVTRHAKDNGEDDHHAIDRDHLRKAMESHGISIEERFPSDEEEKFGLTPHPFHQQFLKENPPS